MSATGKTTAGFTIAELLVVLVIIGGLAAAAASLIAPKPEGAMVRTARDMLVADLRRQRMAAIAGNRAHGVAIREDGTGYRLLPQENAIRLPEALRISRRGEGNIVFFPDGSSSGGLLRLKAGTVDLGLKIDPLLGRIALADGS